jgi:two-component system, OmpR family, sensor kinase
VRVEVVAGADTVRIGVRDTGPGMDQTQLAHVFDRFWQARAGDRRGAGLGLAIARGIAEAHAGRLWLESEVRRGTQAWLELPIGT